MEDIAAGKIVGSSDFRPAGCFRLCLLFHDAGTFQAELYAGSRMDRVVDASVARDKASEHGTVGSIDDGIGGYAGNIFLPKINTLLQWGHARQRNNTFFFQHGMQICVLYIQNFFRDGFWGTEYKRKNGG